jgi:phosphate transport system substrate-binding protein
LWSIVVTACQRQSEEPPKPGAQISGAGATFPAPLYLNWIEEYVKGHPEKAVFYEPAGSGESALRFLKQEADFGASNAALTDEQIAQVDRGAKLIPVSRDDRACLQSSQGA